MKITEILPTELVVPQLVQSSKKAVLRELAGHLVRVYPSIDIEQLVQVLWERESLGSTAIGDGIAIPHGKLPGIETVLCAFGRHPDGVDFDSLDGKPTHIFFVLIAPENSVGQHLKALARVSRLLKNQEFRAQLTAGETQEHLYQSICTEDDKY